MYGIGLLGGLALAGWSSAAPGRVEKGRNQSPAPARRCA